MHVEKKYLDAATMIDDALNMDCNSDITFITKYDDATIVLKELFECGDFIPCLINIEDVGYRGYDKEFIITVNDDGEVFCEKYHRENGYFIPNDGVIFVLPDCTEECVSHLNKYKDRIYIDVVFEDEIESCNCHKFGDDTLFVVSCDDDCAVPCRDSNGFVTGYITSIFSI